MTSGDRRDDRWCPAVPAEWATAAGQLSGQLVPGAQGPTHPSCHGTSVPLPSSRFSQLHTNCPRVSLKSPASCVIHAFARQGYVSRLPRGSLQPSNTLVAIKGHLQITTEIDGKLKLSNLSSHDGCCIISACWRRRTSSVLRVRRSS